MAKKKDEQNLPLKAENDTEPSNSIHYADEVIAIIAGLAASEVEGVAGMINISSSIKGKNKNVTKGVKVEVGDEEVSVDLYLNVEYGVPIQRVAHDVQEGVKRSIESMTGLHVVRVDVHVQSVSFEQDKKALQAGAQQAALVAGEVAETVKLPETEKASPAAREKSKKPAASEQKEEPSEKPKADPKPKAKTVKKPEETEQKPEEGKAPDEAGEKK